MKMQPREARTQAGLMPLDEPSYPRWRWLYLGVGLVLDFLLLGDLAIRIQPSMHFAFPDVIWTIVIALCSLGGIHLIFSSPLRWLQRQSKIHTLVILSAIWAVLHSLCVGALFLFAGPHWLLTAVGAAKWWNAPVNGSFVMVHNQISFLMGESIHTVASLVGMHFFHQWAFCVVENNKRFQNVATHLVGFGAGIGCLAPLAHFSIMQIPQQYDLRPPVSGTHIANILITRELFWSTIAAAGVLAVMAGVWMVARRIMKPGKR